MALLDKPAAAELSTTPQPARRRGLFALGIALSFLSALLLYVMWDGNGNLWPLILVAFVPMFIAQYRLLPRKWSGLAVGIAAGGYWYAVASSFNAVITLPEVLAFAVVLGLIWWGIASFDRPFAERTKFKYFIFQLPLLWVALEVIFGTNLLLGSNYWLAYRFAAAPELIQPVSIFSSAALSFMLVMFNAIIALTLIKLIDRRYPDLATVHIPNRIYKWASIIAFGASLLWVASSLFIYNQVNADMGPQIKVAVVQTGLTNTTSNGTVGASYDVNSPANVARDSALKAQLITQTQQAATQGAQVVVWPEETLDYDPATAQGAWVSQLAQTTNTTIVVGYQPTPGLADPNMAAVFLPSGQLAGDPYYKIHPVIAEGEAFKTPRNHPVYETPAVKLGLLICFDHDFPDSTARKDALAGAQLLAVPAVDPSSVTGVRWQSLVFRAVENRVPVAKADIAYDSVIVNGNGQVEARQAVANPNGAAAVMVASVNVGPGHAPFSFYGGVPFYILIGLGLIFRIADQIRLRRRDGKLPAGK